MLKLKPLSVDQSRSVVQSDTNPTCYFHFAYEFNARILAQMLDSLVRVSRRVEKNHLVNVLERQHFSHGMASSTLGVLHRFRLDFQPSHALLSRGKDRNKSFRNATAIRQA